MKKSKIVTLALITSALVTACQDSKKEDWAAEDKRKVYVRSDTTASYTRSHFGSGMLWFLAFRSFGSIGGNGMYQRSGYYSGGIHQSSNVGRNATKSGIVRGGFGGSSVRSGLS